jgi:hypothetical protein
MQRTLIAIFVSLFLAMPALPAGATPASPSRPVAASQQSSSEGARTPRTDVERYRAREHASPQVANYRGGDVIVISAGVTAIVLAIILVVVLL